MIKPYFETDLGKLYHGDCLETMPQFEPVDLVVTSPPYDNMRTYSGNSDFDFEGTARELFRVAKGGGVVVWVVGDQTIKGSETLTSFKQALFFSQLGFNVETMIWNKPPQGANGSNWYYPQSMEYMFIFSHGKPATVNKLKDRRNTGWGRAYEKTCGGKNTKIGARKTGQIGIVGEFGYRTNVWNIIKESSGNAHPAPFPVDLARDHIHSWSNEGDTVIDPFIGSGTTAIACECLNRRWIGIEISEQYCEISAKRIEQEAKQLKLFTTRDKTRQSEDPLD